MFHSHEHAWKHISCGCRGFEEFSWCLEYGTIAILMPGYMLVFFAVLLLGSMDCWLCGSVLRSGVRVKSSLFNRWIQLCLSVKDCSLLQWSSFDGTGIFKKKVCTGWRGVRNQICVCTTGNLVLKSQDWGLIPKQNVRSVLPAKTLNSFFYHWVLWLCWLTGRVAQCTEQQ